MKFKNQLLNVLLYIFFTVIIGLTFIAAVNINQTNVSLDQSIKTIDKELKQKNKESEIVLTEQLSKLKEIKNQILDSNTTSFLFQITNIFLFTLGLYVLNQMNNQTKISKQTLTKFENELIRVKFLSSIIRDCEGIYFLSQKLSTHDVMSHDNLNSNHNILIRIENIKGEFYNHLRSVRFEPNEKRNMLDLLGEAKVKLETLSSLESHFKGSYSDLVYIIGEIKKNSAANTRS